MFFKVLTKDMATKASHEVLHISIRVQTSGNIDLERNETEEITREGNMERGKPPHLVPPINKNRKGYVKRVKILPSHPRIKIVPPKAREFNVNNP
jgi:hypothetical protein